MIPVTLDKKLESCCPVQRSGANARTLVLSPLHQGATYYRVSRACRDKPKKQVPVVEYPHSRIEAAELQKGAAPNEEAASCHPARDGEEGLRRQSFQRTSFTPPPSFRLLYNAGEDEVGTGELSASEEFLQEVWIPDIVVIEKRDPFALCCGGA
jgi:hypothetical protein